MFVASISAMALGILVTVWAILTGRKDALWVRPALAGFTLIAALLQDYMFGRIVFGTLALLFALGALLHYRRKKTT